MTPLISDAESKPAAAMREGIAPGDVGDEQRGQDPTVNQLQESIETVPDAATTPTCANCGAELSAHWCAKCGQESMAGHSTRRTLHRQWERVRHSMVALVVHPGLLTAEFRDGQRARSITPWRLAFNIITIFFVLSFVTDFHAANFPRQFTTGTLAGLIGTTAQQAKVDEATFAERVDRRFNAVFTALTVILIAITTVLARLTHPGRREGWSVHFVFALHLTAWSFIVNFVYYSVMRLLGLASYATTNDPHVRNAGIALFAVILLWQFGYVLLAFRRVYADGWIAAGSKAAVMVGVRLFANNGLVILALYLAVKTLTLMP
jgi:hypothetical protein